jgi:hypothetical protein
MKIESKFGIWWLEVGGRNMEFSIVKLSDRKNASCSENVTFLQLLNLGLAI